MCKCGCCGLVHGLLKLLSSPSWPCYLPLLRSLPFFSLLPPPPPPRCQPQHPSVEGHHHPAQVHIRRHQHQLHQRGLPQRVQRSVGGATQLVLHPKLWDTHLLLIPVAAMGKCKQANKFQLHHYGHLTSLIIHERNRRNSRFKVVLP